LACSGVAFSSLPSRLREAVLTALHADQRWGADLLPLLLMCSGAQDDDELLRLMVPAALERRGLLSTELVAESVYHDRAVVCTGCSVFHERAGQRGRQPGPALQDVPARGLVVH
jgi:hypothetical protein